MVSKVSPDFGFNKDFKVVIINMFKELKETVFKELKESMTTVNQQMEILIKDIKITFLTKEPSRNSLVQDTIIEMKKSLRETNSF